MAHEHSHHSHAHTQPLSHSRAFIMAITLNLVFVVIEFVAGVITNSTALMADAGHNLSDVLCLLLSWGAMILNKKHPSERYTYGFRSSSILAALANAMLLLVACGAIALEACERFASPPAVEGTMVAVIAAIGIVVNGFSAWLFFTGSKGDLNIRSAYAHMVADAAVSIGVVIAGVVMSYSGWYWVDPVLSLVIVLIILVGTWELLQDSLLLALGGVPAHIDLAAIDEYLRTLPGVTAIHDLHVWGISTTENALTVHLVVPAGYPGDAFMDDVVHALKTQFSIHHSTLQVEQGTTDHHCALHVH